MTDKKWGLKELLGEVERLLFLANSGLLLLEHLCRDVKLREEFFKHLYKMASDPEVAKE